MADRSEIDSIYGVIDRLFRASIGELQDFSGAKYDGDPSLTLEEAQRRKHEFIFESLRLRPGSRVLDLGCGWGPMLRYFRSRGVVGVGVTLSSAQAEAGRRHGLEVHLLDARAVRLETFGPFDGLVSLGAFEHFCSPREYLEGRQDAVYTDLFRGAADLLPAGGRFYLQTMVFGRRMIPWERIDINADHDSDAFMLARMRSMFPGSWLPYGSEHLERTSRPWFRIISSSSGRLDYIETIRQWDRRFKRMSLKKIPLYLSLLPRFLANRSFRQAIGYGGSANTECFKRDLLDHYRLVLEKA
ncbi:MAG TPA: class I SAM-dependent methyltransferase [Gemmatimonadales bacterium]|jgi:cyclopropane-fatty-acyl-phospholipid synthase|nr:class I SAM-dependent methyltransferase [Gemmatimonadales bacterium]